MNCSTHNLSVHHLHVSICECNIHNWINGFFFRCAKSKTVPSISINGAYFIFKIHPVDCDPIFFTDFATKSYFAGDEIIANVLNGMAKLILPPCSHFDGFMLYVC